MNDASAPGDTMRQKLARELQLHKDHIARLIVERQWVRHPSFHERYGDAGRAKCQQDVCYNLAYLAQAIVANSPTLFTAYVHWISVLFSGLGIPTRKLAESLEITGDVLRGRVPDAAGVVDEFIELGLRHVSECPEPLPSFIDPACPLADLAGRYLDALLRGDRTVAGGLILDAVAAGAAVRDIYLHVFQPTQYEIGRLWQMNRATVAQEHYATAATQLIMSQLYPRIFNSKRIGRCLVATGVGGELHEIGLRFVSDFFEMAGWDTYYLGSNTPTFTILQALRERRADLLAISVTMTFHLPLVTELIERVRAERLDRPIRILVGGYPFNIDPELWRRLGADGYAADAEQAIVTADALLRARA